MALALRDYQLSAISKMSNGCILCGGVGSGKSITALAYYYVQQGGVLFDPCSFPVMDNPKRLYIITTAHKRDTLEWDKELTHFLMSRYSDDNLNECEPVVVDSWNNITKYTEVSNAFFIFDEQRVVGTGTWVKAFLKITRKNDWILLSATPGDTWSDYIPVFIANGFFRNKKEFIDNHVVYSRYTKYPKIERYLDTGRLIRLRNKILVDMDFERHTVSHHEDIYCDYDISEYKDIMKNRWNNYEGRPVQNAAELCYILRRVVNSHVSRTEAILKLFEKHPKMIVFYNFDYELDILRSIDWGKAEVAEWNGHKHQEMPKSDSWIYLVQYTAGCEGWNCITTDTVVFWSQNYSYKVLEQARGRIDRMNTPYTDLYYYHLKSHANIDLGISRAIKSKKKFNETRFVSSF